MINKYSELFACFRSVFESVFNEQVNESKEVVEAVCLGDEIIVASLKLSGDLPGVLNMVLRKEEVDTVAKRMLKRFSIDIPLENNIVFDEVLNICAGNLATKLKQMGMDINISVPDKTKEHCSEADVVYSYRISTKDHYIFKFCIPLSPEEIKGLAN